MPAILENLSEKPTSLGKVKSTRKMSDSGSSKAQSINKKSRPVSAYFSLGVSILKEGLLGVHDREALNRQKVVRDGNGEYL
jgi:hypothetical protein